MKLNRGHCVGFRCMRPLTLPARGQLCSECHKERAAEEQREREAANNGEGLRDQYDSAVDA